MGSRHTTIIYSDHKNLTYYWSAQNLNQQPARWSLYLSEFDVKLVHLAGSKMILSDTLSRRPDHCPEEDNDNKDVVMLPDRLFLNLLHIDLQTEIAKSTNYNFDIANILKSLLKGAPSTLKQDLSDWSVEEFNRANVMFYKGKNYIPRNEGLRRKILVLHHDHETAGHPGELETFNSVSKGFWWPGLRSYVKGYVKRCSIC